MTEKRKEPRWPSFLAARIMLPDRKSTVDCLVRNMSGSGVKLKVASAAMIPSRFELDVPQKSMRYRARVIWRTADEIGAEVEEIGRDDDRHPANIEKLKRENATLRSRLAKDGRSPV